MLIFAEKALCIRCHNGPLLANQSSQNVLIPGPGIDGRGHDQGRYEWDKREAFKYKFLTSA